MVENKYTIDDVRDVAGDKTTNILKGMFEDEDKIVDWFYNKPNNYFLGKTPNEICKEGKASKLESALIDVITGGMGG